MTTETGIQPERDAWHWLHDNGFSWDDVNAIAAVLEAGGYDILQPQAPSKEWTDWATA